MPNLAARLPTYAMIAASLAVPFEGLYTRAYHDKLAHGLPTVCYGMTKYDRPVKMGDEYTQAQCEAFLAEDLVKYHDQIFHCIHVKLTDEEWGATTDLAYNVGSGTVCKSTVVKLFNKGEHAMACNYIAAYNKASGHVVRGLTRRRDAEIRVCKGKA